MEPESVSKNLPKGDTVLHASGNKSEKEARGKIVPVSAKIDQYIAESKEYHIESYIRKGFYLDCKDDYNWCVASIASIEDEGNLLNIHFDNWSSKYDEEIKLTSKKIFPLRYYSTGYTGQKKSTLREFDSGLKRKQEIIDKMEAYAKIRFACESQNDIQEMYQFLCGECYLYLDSMVT